MNIIHKPLIAIALLAAGATAQAADTLPNGYVEGAYLWLTDSVAGYSISPTAVAVRLGTHIDEHWAVEAVGAVGAADGRIGPVSARVDSAYGAYLKAILPATDTFSVFARAGYLHANVSASGGGFTLTGNDGGFSYGAGVSVMIGQRWHVLADYMSYYAKGGETVTGPSLGFGVRF